ncbi:MAG: thiamine ABC transporter substrate-binding protein [Anaerolineales bacterium]|nr:thiamine ABC transporter substrate-binding protein [Anaerolineales bacterium]
MKIKTILILALLILMALSACSAKNTEPRVLTVMTHDSFAISEEILAQFEQENNVKVEFLLSGDVGTALNKAALSVDNPLADVFYGVDNTFLSRALDEGIFEPYDSPLLEEIPDSFQLDPENRALPVDFGDVCLNYDIAYFEDSGIAPPTSLQDLTLPEYYGLTVVENPATSSPGLSFLFATIGSFGEESYLDYWQALKVNGMKVDNDWETAYYTDFSRWGGEYPIVVSYTSSPPFELLYAEEPMDTPPTRAVISDGSCFRQIEFVGILKGTENRDLAEKWVDFMLSTTVQEDIPLQMYVFPVNTNAALDETFVNYLESPENPIVLTYQQISENREAWINEWTEAVLR